MSRHVSMFRGKSALFVLAATLLLLPVFARAALNRYALILADPPAGARFISRESLAAVDARNYRAQLELKQRSLIAELRMRNITAVGAVSTVLNAVFVTAPAERVDEMKALPGVAGVVRMRRGRPLLNTATQLLNAPAAWALPAIGGQLNAGKGIKIGILDSGIDQNHPAFQDSTLTLPKGNYPICTPGYPDDCGYTNSKVIVARSYVRQIAGFQYHGDNITGPPDPATSQPDDYSPRDRFGHGTAVASCAAANPTSTGAVPISGMAPKAYLGNYKIAGSPGVNDSPPEDVWIQAINDALNDGMDVVNMSWGTTPISGALDTGAACGQAAGVPCDLLATAFENAAQHGLVIVAAAGNSGSLGDAYSYYPVYNSISSPANAPSVLAVGATLNSHTFWPTVSVAGPGAPSTLQNLKAFPSDSFLFAYYGSLIAPLLDASTKGDGYACSAFPPGSFAGVYALVQRGPTGANACDFNTKATNVQNAGATGMILYNSADSPALPNNNTTIEGVASFVGPLVGLTNTDGVALKSYLAANPGALVSIDLSGVAHAPDGVANQLASYSSFGPGLGAFPACATCSKLLLKPDLLATGGGDPNIYPDPSGNGVDLYGFPGIYMATQSFDTMGVLYGANGYAASNGTSFASPLVAGAAALVKQAHPGWTAAQIRSALVNWANASAVTSDDMGQITQLDVRNVGGGLLDAAAAVNATVVANPATVSFGGLKTGGAMPAAQPITVTNVSSSPVSLTVAVSPLAGQSGLSANIALDKQTLNLGAAGSSSDTAVLTVSMTGSIPAATGAYSGNILLASSGAVMRIPYLFLVGSNTASSGGNIVPISVTSVDGFVSQDLGALAVQVLDTAGVPVVGAPVTFSRSSGSVTLTLRSAGGGEPACSPDSSTTAVTCNTDNYGIAYVDLVGGSTPGTSTVTIQVPGYTAVQYPSFSVNLRLIPDTRNVTESAQYVSTIAPGSYVSLFGLNLSDLQDSAATTTLPLSLDGVTVSFDAGNVSAPGSITFVSPSQVNVQAPWELQGLPAGTQVKMKVTINETEYGTVFSAPLADISPAFFNDNNAGLVAARDATYNQITASHPAVRGEAVLLYLNGLGPVDHPLASGAPASSTTLARTTSQPTVTIGGQNAEVLFSGLAPGYPGLYQVNVKVPQNIATGNQPIGISIGGKSSPATVTLNGKAVAMVLPVQ